MSHHLQINPSDLSKYDAALSLVDPIKEYEKLMDDYERVKADDSVPDDLEDIILDKITAAARNAIWRLLFETPHPTQDRLEKAGDFLKIHKDDAGFYSPTEYNDWIVEVRDELLKRNMLDFWKDVIVAKELGPAWARDSDLYDDLHDPEPANFYKYAGCEAAWLKK